MKFSLCYILLIFSFCLFFNCIIVLSYYNVDIEKKIHTTRNTFKRENFNMKLFFTEIAFHSFKQFGYLSLYIVGNGDSVETFCLFLSP